jgi:hypothetical protein
MVAGCGSQHTGPLTRSPIGGVCKANSDCFEGMTPTCWDVNYLDRIGEPVTPGGYCSSPCASDADCGSLGKCIDEGADGSWCFAPCSTAADCRTGYACYSRITGHCFPSSGLNCDPTAGDGSCTGMGALPGGCVRRAVGTGLTGNCLDGCAAGSGSCPVVNNVNRQCIVVDETGQGDQFKGPVCVTAYSSNAVGQECTAGGVDALDACIDGAECFLSAFPSGDNHCRQMCTAGGAPACAGSACADVFGLFGSSNPVGLCL